MKKIVADCITQRKDARKTDPPAANLQKKQRTRKKDETRIGGMEQEIHRIRTSTQSQKSSQIRLWRTFKKTLTNILKETSNYLMVATQYFASQKGFIFRGVLHASADIGATMEETKWTDRDKNRHNKQ